jgi:hypothetical protein
MLDEGFEQPRAAAAVMVGFERPWCIAGGWAIDLAVGRATREHKDVEIAVFRQDYEALTEYLRGWRFDVLSHHEIHAKSASGFPLEILLNDCDPIDWIYRRDARIRRSMEKTIRRGREGIPVLAAEIALLYKSKNTRAADELDFRVARQILEDESRDWLIDALRVTAPSHPWLKSLEG